MKAMLEELKKLDEETWIEIENNEFDVNYLNLDTIQGCIQRAIEARGWDLQQSARGVAQKSFKAIIEYWIDLPMIIQQPEEYYRSYHRIEEGSDSPASALLACYLKAIR